MLSSSLRGFWGPTLSVEFSVSSGTSWDLSPSSSRLNSGLEKAKLGMEEQGVHPRGEVLWPCGPTHKYPRTLSPMSRAEQFCQVPWEQSPVGANLCLAQLQSSNQESHGLQSSAIKCYWQRGKDWIAPLLNTFFDCRFIYMPAPQPKARCGWQLYALGKPWYLFLSYFSVCPCMSLRETVRPNGNPMSYGLVLA